MENSKNLFDKYSYVLNLIENNDSATLVEPHDNLMWLVLSCSGKLEYDWVKDNIDNGDNFL